MRIAIVAPATEPFRAGSAEHLWRGMLRHLNQATGHHADLVKLPFRDGSLVDILAGYEAFSRLDLSGFDQVVTTRYPAWIASHPNHVVYAERHCRAYYEAYPPQAGYACDGGAGTKRLLAFLAQRRGERAALPELFARVREVAASEPGRAELERHPGPLGRALVLFLDEVALSQRAVRRHVAATQAARKRLPPVVARREVHVVPPPPALAAAPGAAGEYFLAVGALHPDNRIDLLIEAYRRAAVAIPLRIVGGGPEEARLRELSGGDARIELTGFVGRARLAQLYAGALAVACAARDALYNAVPLEAMLAGKPVIALEDGGGALEALDDAGAAVLARPEPDAIAAAFARLAGDRAAAAEMGRRALERARSFSWPRVFDALLLEPGAPARVATRRAPRPRVTVLNAYSVFPPDSGGRYRLHSLYNALARRLDVDLVTLALHAEGDDAIRLGEGFRELRIARTRAHAQADQAAHAAAHVPVYDITALENIRLTPAYLTMLEASLAGAAAVVVSHPYMLQALRETGYRGAFLHEAHNCEHVLKQAMLPESPSRARMLELVARAEGDCCRDAALTFATSREDAAALVAQYGAPPERMIVIPNGTDTRAIRPMDRSARRRLKRRLGLPDWPIAIFLASGHGPNLRSAERLFEVASQAPEVAFALVGSVADAFPPEAFPPNAWRVGPVSEEARNVWLHAADVALNPVLYGGGTNLKLLDYFAAGVPVVSTEVGVRGLGEEAGTVARVAPMEGFAAAIRAVVAGGAEIAATTARARALVEERFDWDALAARLHDEMRARGLV